MKRRFTQWLDEGHNLTFEEIKALNPELKDEYIHHTMNESIKMKNMVNDKIKEVQDLNEELV